LRNLLSDNLGANVAAFYEINFHQLDGVEIDSISVRPASSPVYVGGELYVRDGNGKRKLNVRDAFEYWKVRWPAQI
jgi:predicted HTH transcriptional regulator